MWNLHRLAERKARRDDEIEDWADVLSRAEVKAREAGLNESAFAELVENLKSDFHLVEIFEVMAEHGRQHPRNPRTFQILAEHVDNSSASLADWLESMAHVCGWLYQNRKKMKYEDLLGYIDCCDSAEGGSGIGGSLADEVQEQLDKNGVELAEDWSPASV